MEEDKQATPTFTVGEGGAKPKKIVEVEDDDDVVILEGAGATAPPIDDDCVVDEETRSAKQWDVLVVNDAIDSKLVRKLQRYFAVFTVPATRNNKTATLLINRRLASSTIPPPECEGDRFQTMGLRFCTDENEFINIGVYQSMSLKDAIDLRTDVILNLEAKRMIEALQAKIQHASYLFNLPRDEKYYWDENMAEVMEELTCLQRKFQELYINNKSDIPEEHKEIHHGLMKWKMTYMHRDVQNDKYKTNGLICNCHDA